jgi:VWFA-related protein
MVEYGPVEIGGQTYICPTKSVSVTLAPTLPSNTFEMQRYRGLLLDSDKYAAMEHLQTLLNDAAFIQYHLFRAESRILTGENTTPNQKPPAPVTGAPTESEAPASATNPPPEAPPAQTVAPPIPAADVIASTSTAPSNPEASAPSKSPGPEPTAEITVAESANLPELAATPNRTSGTGFTLRVTSRLVDVGVVALDKKGRPVTNLNEDNFEVYDEGRKQTVRLFQRGGEELAGQIESGASGATTGELIFTNRRANFVETNSQAAQTNAGTTILMIDSSSLAWADLTYAREEMLKFLQKLPPTERVGFYTQSTHGFQVLVEATEDHALLAAKLRAWMPSAQELARARESETRNRQQLDTVLHEEDLQDVNGNTDGAGQTRTMVDPQLRDYGSNPGRATLAILVGAARHLAAIPGHKNLVWIASDNVLADWQDKAVGTDKGSKHVENFILRAQEALNEAQVSLYPLDASQLETMATDSSLKNSSVELDPASSSSQPTQSQQGVPGGRASAEMQQDLHPIQGGIQQLAESTGGRVFRRSGSVATNLNTVVGDGRAVYLLGFAPDTPADDKYHRLTVKLTGRRGVTLRYRTGFLYTREPATIKDRLQQAIWQPVDMSEIAISAHFVPASKGTTLKLNIATNDLALRQQGEHWMDKLDIFMVRRDDEGLHSRITGQTLRLVLKTSTYARLFQEGVPFEQFIEEPQQLGSVRIIVIDENSGSMGSITIPASSLQARN